MSFKRKIFQAVVCLLAAGVAVSTAQADKPGSTDQGPRKSLGQYGNWSATGFILGEKREICSASSPPINPRPVSPVSWAKLHVGLAPKDVVVQSFPEKQYRPSSSVEVRIDDTRFMLRADQDGAGEPHKPQLNLRLIEAMKRGKTATVTGISADGRKFVVSYSLEGFRQAFDVIRKRCPFK